jgi:hypothetical protein
MKNRRGRDSKSRRSECAFRAVLASWRMRGSSLQHDAHPCADKRWPAEHLLRGFPCREPVQISLCGQFRLGGHHDQPYSRVLADRPGGPWHDSDCRDSRRCVSRKDGILRAQWQRIVPRAQPGAHDCSAMHSEEGFLPVGHAEQALQQRSLANLLLSDSGNAQRRKDLRVARQRALLQGGLL